MEATTNPASANGVDILPPLDSVDEAKRVCSGLSFVGIPLGTDEFAFVEAKSYVDEATKTIQALVDFAEKGPQDTSDSATRFTHASYAHHLFYQCGLPKFDYLFHHVPARILAMHGLLDRIQNLLDTSFARIAGITESLEKHKDDNICTKVLLRLAHRWGGLGIPDVKVLSPVAYLSTLRGTVRSVVDTLPDRWKRRLHNDPVHGFVL